MLTCVCLYSDVCAKGQQRVTSAHMCRTFESRDFRYRRRRTSAATGWLVAIDEVSVRRLRDCEGFSLSTLLRRSIDTSLHASHTDASAAILWRPGSFNVTPNRTSRQISLYWHACHVISWSETTDGKMTSFPKSWYTAFSFSGWILIHRVKTMGTLGKINVIWWNIKINLQKLVDIYVDMNCQQICKISHKKT